MNRVYSRQRSPGRPKGGSPRGCLVVVTAAELFALDLMLTAARRRMPDTTFVFPRRITTRRNGPSDTELPVSRALFRQIERDGGFVATWQAGGHRFGLPDSLVKQIVDGDSVVIAAPADVADDLNETCADVHAVRLTGELDAARQALAPRACLRRIVGPRHAARLEARSPAMQTNALAHDGDIRSAVRVLTAALVQIERKHRSSPACSGVRPGAGPRAPGARFRRIPTTTAAL